MVPVYHFLFLASNPLSRGKSVNPLVYGRLLQGSLHSSSNAF